jgi:hypothetical protein
MAAGMAALMVVVKVALLVVARAVLLAAWMV